MAAYTEPSFTGGPSQAASAAMVASYSPVMDRAAAELSEPRTLRVGRAAQTFSTGCTDRSGGGALGIAKITCGLVLEHRESESRWADVRSTTYRRVRTRFLPSSPGGTRYPRNSGPVAKMRAWRSRCK